MNFTTLLNIFSSNNCHKIYVKKLAANDNSKNQVYFGGSFDVLNILPSGEIITDQNGSRVRESFKSKLDYYWIDQDGSAAWAPNAQLILYPDYPEVRFSGFLSGCKKSPSTLMNSRLENRLLIMGISDDRKIYGIVAEQDSEISKEFLAIKNPETHGVFYKISLINNRIETDSKTKLLQELKRIHNAGWIQSKRLTPTYNIVPCEFSNCGGFTLEAELNIPSNADASPDYLGWEIKQFRVDNFDKINSKVISLMDHSPTGGYFNENGVEAFIQKYGYADRKGRESRMNFGGIHKVDLIHHLTSLKLIIEGFDSENNKITDTNGYVALVDQKDNLAAAWSFSSFIEHWNSKHSNACYVPSKIQRTKMENSIQQYAYGNKIILGCVTDVTLLLSDLSKRTVYYDPGIKLELAIDGERKKSVKVRSLFRIKSGDLPSLYKSNEVIDLNFIK
jgi:hypothetical protein